MSNKKTCLIDKEHIDVFCKVLNIASDEIEKVYVNPGRSANNENFVIVVNGDSYLYRVPGLGTDKFCDRARESEAYKMLAPLEITDQVMYLCKDTGIKISKYYEESRIPLNENKDELKASMQTMRRLHEENLQIPYTDTLFDRMKRYRTFALDAGGEKYYLPGFDEYLVNMQELEQNLDKLNIKFCFTHGDVSINNMLITKEYPYPILIDMEFPAMGDPIGDIATFCVDAEYRKDDIVLMLEYYLGKKPTLTEQYHVLGLSAAAGMMWYSWATYKAAVEEDNQLFLDFRNDYHQYIKEVYGSTLEVFQHIKDNFK